MRKTHDYIHHYRGSNGYPSWCRIRIYENPGSEKNPSSPPHVICTEPVEPSGNSVTNAAEYLAAEIKVRHGLDGMVWIEHYDREVPEAGDYSLVTFSFNEPQDLLSCGRWLKTLGEPNWRHFSHKQVENLLGDQAPHIRDG